MATVDYYLTKPEPFGPDERKVISLHDFVQHDIGLNSDQYRNVQPGLMFKYIGAIADAVSNRLYEGPPFWLDFGWDAERKQWGPVDQWNEFFRLVQAWVADLGPTEEGEYDAYGGCETAEPLATLIHEIYWQSGRHPTYRSLEEMIACQDHGPDEDRYDVLDRLRGEAEPTS
jgi:hypothetical protein